MAYTRYTPTKNGYLISGSAELFNRTLYGSHKNDDKSEKYCTFAGDAPQFLGATTDWKKNLYSFYAKCGTLTSGLAFTPSERTGFFYSEDVDTSSRWFHNSEDVTSEFKNGWTEYELTQISPWFADVKVNIQIYPLLPDDGFLAHYRITTDQRIIFVAGFGGITDYIGRFEYNDEKIRYFSAKDCKDNSVKIGKNRAYISHPGGSSMRIAASFPADFSVGSAKVLESRYPGMFLGSRAEGADDRAVRISAVIEQGKTFDGYIIAVHNSDEKTLDKWLSLNNPVEYIKEQIYSKFSCINMSTPDQMLDLTVNPTVIALDASWHKNSFHHGAFGYHSPFLGWRNWYAPTVLGWGDRVETTIEAHLNQMVRKTDGKERVWFDGGQPREWDGPSPYHSIENSTGYLSYFLGETMPYYNMQECATDMIMYYIEWTGNLELAARHFDDLCAMLDWEERIFDPDGDGLYQNFLNTWISDGHSYNGAGCAQSSAYNYRANSVMAKIALKLGKPEKVFTERAGKIKRAVNEKLWIKDLGVIAESKDTVCNKLIHPSPELSTIYLAIDCDVVDMFKGYETLKYTENYIKSIKTPVRGGRLSYSSDWLPKKYSTCGIFPSENAHLALAYFKLGLSKEGNEILKGLSDCYFTGKNPGLAAHIQSAKCTSDLADLDFTDVSSTYLRVLVEGLFGIKIDAIENTINIAPNFPEEWKNASLVLKDISLNYNKKGNARILDIYCDKGGVKRFRLPLGSDNIEAVLLDGTPVGYKIAAAPGNSFISVETEKTGRIQLRVMEGEAFMPSLKYSDCVLSGNEVVFRVTGGEITDYIDLSDTLRNIEIKNNKLYAKVSGTGRRTLFIRVKSGVYDAYLAADYEVVDKEKEEESYGIKEYKTVDISAYFNCKMTELHDKKYLSPRPEGYSIGVFPNGRYAWEWNHKGHNEVYIDDAALRNSGGTICVGSGIPFLTPKENENLACVSQWDNFPSEINIPLDGKASELAILFMATTNCMQTRVENARITVNYDDGSSEKVSLVYPFNIDDFMVPALQTESETFYFNDYNHAVVQRIKLDRGKKLAGVKIHAVANEVILGVISVSLGEE